MLEVLNLEKLSHASIIFLPVSSFANAISFLNKNILKEEIIEHEFRHTDLLVIEMVSANVEDVSMISSFNSRRALGKNKVMIVSAQSITVQAQNALLKIIEEPSPNTFFFFIVPSKSQILPTLMSRFREISLDLELEHSNNPALNPENFLKKPVATRLEIIKEILVFLEKEKITRGQISEFISEVVAMRHKTKLSKASLKTIVSVEHFMRDTASSMKLCLEYLALAV